VQSCGHAFGKGPATDAIHVEGFMPLASVQILQLNSAFAIQFLLSRCSRWRIEFSPVLWLYLRCWDESVEWAASCGMVTCMKVSLNLIYSSFLLH
jgi:hypothetical protein